MANIVINSTASNFVNVQHLQPFFVFYCKYDLKTNVWKWLNIAIMYDTCFIYVKKYVGHHLSIFLHYHVWAKTWNALVSHSQCD